MVTSETNGLVLNQENCGTLPARPVSGSAALSTKLIRELNHSETGRREVAARCLVAMGQPAVPYLLDSMKHSPNPKVRWTVAWILSSMEDSGVRQTVRELTRDEIQSNGATERGKTTIIHFCGMCGKRVTQAAIDKGDARMIDPTHAICSVCENQKPGRPKNRRNRSRSRTIARIAAKASGVTSRGLVTGLFVASTLVFAFVIR